MQHVQMLVRPGTPSTILRMVPLPPGGRQSNAPLRTFIRLICRKTTINPGSRGAPLVVSKGVTGSPEGSEGGDRNPPLIPLGQRSASPPQNPQKRKKHEGFSCFKLTRERRSRFALPVSRPICFFLRLKGIRSGLAPNPTRDFCLLARRSSVSPVLKPHRGFIHCRASSDKSEPLTPCTLRAYIRKVNLFSPLRPAHTGCPDQRLLRSYRPNPPAAQPVSPFRREGHTPLPGHPPQSP